MMWCGWPTHLVGRLCGLAVWLAAWWWRQVAAAVVVGARRQLCTLLDMLR